MTYLVDSSAIWRIQRDQSVRQRWVTSIEDGELRSCAPQRVEFVRSARNPSELAEMSEYLTLFHPDVTVPKSIWRWIDSAQRSLAQAGVLRAFGIVDLLICGTAAYHGLTVVHDDHDFETAARYLPDVRQRRL